MASDELRPDSDKRNQADVYEKYFDRILAKTESSKQDLEKNWMGQITSIALSLALVAGLGEVVARKLFDEPDRYAILFLILPVVNTFLFVRFGLIAATFSKARYNAEKLADELNRLQPLPAAFDISQIYKTNSYFEWAHQTSSVSTILFLMTIPLVFSLNHSLSIYLIHKLVGSGWIFYPILLGYIVVCGICYTTYYKGNKDNTPVFAGKENLFIIGTITVAVLATALMLAMLGRFDPRPGNVVITVESAVTAGRPRGRPPQPDLRLPLPSRAA